jgi:hypothetical protein
MAVHGHVIQIAFIFGDQWQVIDADNETVFVGTKAQIEDWLDWLENIQREDLPLSKVEPEALS